MNIGIISLGLIGGSLFKCLIETDNKIYAVTRNKETIEDAKKYSSFVSDNLNILKDCDIIFVASPINKTIEMLDELEKIVSNKTIVLDCASVKEFIMMKKRPYKFIGSHPMAGTEFSGFKNSFKELFDEAKWVLIPQDNVLPEDVQLVQRIISLTGAKTIIAEAKEHDIAVALISHMPMLVSQAIFSAAMNNNLAMKLASSGFRDMTRLAMSNTDMASDMLNYNTENINQAVNLLESSLNSLRTTKYYEKIMDIKNKRSVMYSKDGKNIF